MEQDKKMRTKYRTTNGSEYNASLKARGSLTVWLDKEMQWLAQPNGKRGRNQTFSDAAIQSCLSIKCLFGQPLRQSLGISANHHCTVYLGANTKPQCRAYYYAPAQSSSTQNDEGPMARTFERQVVELHVRVALLNRFSQLGRPVTVAMA